MCEMSAPTTVYEAMPMIVQMFAEPIVELRQRRSRGRPLMRSRFGDASEIAARGGV
jgi:hypothetical protein